MHRHGGTGPIAHGLPLPEHQPLRGEFPQDGGQAAGVGEAQPADPRHQFGKEPPGGWGVGNGEDGEGAGTEDMGVSLAIIHSYLASDLSITHLLFHVPLGVNKGLFGFFNLNKYIINKINLKIKFTIVKNMIQ